MALIIGIMALINAAGYAAVVWAFRASFRELTSATWWFAMAFAILAGAIIARGLYWDFVLPLLRHYSPGAASAWVDTVSGRMINIVFASMKMLSFMFALKCRHMLIPEEERKKWPWWWSWTHPSKIRLLPWRY